MKNIKKIALLAITFSSIQFNCWSLDLIPVLTNNIMGNSLNVYQIPSEDYIFNFLKNKNDFEILESNGKTALFSKNDEFYFIGETDKNMTGFILQGKVKFMVKAIGQIAFKKLLEKASTQN
ncbi:MAG: hypothetical protein ACRC0V_09460 [Fusobacteriaceae bacterium]